MCVFYFSILICIKIQITQAHVHSVAGGGFLPFLKIILQFYLHNRHLVQFHLGYPNIYIKFMKIYNYTHMREREKKNNPCYTDMKAHIHSVAGAGFLLLFFNSSMWVIPT